MMALPAGTPSQNAHACRAASHTTMDTRTLTLLEYDQIRLMLSQQAATALGKELIHRMRPVRDPLLIQTRLTETAEALTLLADAHDVPFGGISDIREAVTRASKQGVLCAQELLDITATLRGCRRLRRALPPTAERCPHLAAQRVQLREFPTVENALTHALAENGEVLDAASPELARIRRRVRALHEQLQAELHRLLASPSIVEILQDPLITQRNGRFCVPVRAEQRNTLKGIVHDISASGQTVFLEPLSVVELGNDIREAERQEEEEVLRVLTFLSDLVGKAATPLFETLDVAARLDAIFARAHLAHAQEAVCPQLNSDGRIDLIQARHPLLGAQAVPIDVTFGSPEQEALLITGPNTGGKTVTLKTVGLLTAMAQSGLYIPAQAGSTLAIFEQIFADIGDEQSIAQNLSTFSGHLRTIVRLIHDAGPRALILLDEIGAGTDPTEGAALAKAILLELTARGCRIIATTHYGELKVFAHNTPGFLNASVEFDLETLRPTYRVISGLPGSSNALAIAGRLGLPKALVARARDLMGEAPQAMEQVLKQAEGVRRALDRELTGAQRANKEAQTRATALTDEQRAFAEQREAALARARHQAREIVQKAREEASTLLEELKAAIRAHRDVAPTNGPHPTLAGSRAHTHQTLNALDTLIEETAPATPPPSPPPLPSAPRLTTVVAGQSVYIPSVGHRGRVLESGAGDEEVMVQVGIMRLRVSIASLEPVAPHSDNSYIPPPPSSRHFAVLPDEIHLRGFHAEEALTRLDAYLYEAIESRKAHIRIIHGFGTGALRKAIHEFLRSHPAVLRFRAGDAGEGGGGVTIAELHTS
jgi:DNA mismatch repair protein MutS2